MTMSKISRGGYNPDKNWDGTGQDRVRMTKSPRSHLCIKITILNLRNKNRGKLRFFPMLLGQISSNFEIKSRGKLRTIPTIPNLSPKVEEDQVDLDCTRSRKSWLFPIFHFGRDGLGSSILTKIRDRGAYKILISIFDTTSIHPMTTVPLTTRPRQLAQDNSSPIHKSRQLVPYA